MGQLQSSAGQPPSPMSGEMRISKPLALTIFSPTSTITACTHSLGTYQCTNLHMQLLYARSTPGEVVLLISDDLVLGAERNAAPHTLVQVALGTRLLQVVPEAHSSARRRQHHSFHFGFHTRAQYVQGAEDGGVKHLRLLINSSETILSN